MVELNNITEEEKNKVMLELFALPQKDMVGNRWSIEEIKIYHKSKLATCPSVLLY